MSLKNKQLVEGRKRLKAMKGVAKKRAKFLLAEEAKHGDALGDDLKLELNQSRAMFETHHTLKGNQIDAVIIDRIGLLRTWQSMLVLKTPIGVPNVIGAPGDISDEASAIKAMEPLLVAAFVKIEETQAMHRRGEITPETKDLRLFLYQDLYLQVPGEFVDLIYKEIGEVTPSADLNKKKGNHIDALARLIGHQKLTENLWGMFTDDKKVQILREAACLLCLNVNRV